MRFSWRNLHKVMPCEMKKEVVQLLKLKCSLDPGFFLFNVFFLGQGEV